MSWNDTVEGDPNKQGDGRPYYEDDGYAPFRDNRAAKKSFFSGIPLRYVFWGVGIAVVLFLILELGPTNRGKDDSARIETLEAKIEFLEKRLEKIDGVEEKVTRIWEQAKTFETFKTRFDRSESSMSLRMDHLAMSLDALQKKSNENIEKIDRIEQTTKNQPPAKSRKSVKKQKTAQTHTVLKGDTLYSIGRKYNLPLETLRSMNKLRENDVIHVGQVLVVK